MKKIYSALSLPLLLFASTLQAQVTNGNFENVKPNFLPSNWGMNFSQPVSLDIPSGQTITDEIQYTWCVPSMVYASMEAQSGLYAMEISNAFNVTQNKVIAGSATIFSDETQDSPGWNAGIPVIPGDHIDMLGFYYKFLPAGNDVAEALIKVFDNNGIQIGEASLDISGTNNQFQYIYMPISYTSNATRAFMTISFNMAKEGSTPTFGSRLLIDHVVTNFAALGLEENPINEQFTLYPTLVDNELNINPGPLQSNVIHYKIIDAQGKIIQQNTTTELSNYIYTMEVSDLNTGMYFLQVDSDKGSVTKKFIKK